MALQPIPWRHKRLSDFFLLSQKAEPPREFHLSTITGIHLKCQYMILVVVSMICDFDHYFKKRFTLITVLSRYSLNTPTTCLIWNFTPSHSHSWLWIAFVYDTSLLMILLVGWLVVSGCWLVGGWWLVGWWFVYDTSLDFGVYLFHDHSCRMILLMTTILHKLMVVHFIPFLCGDMVWIYFSVKIPVQY